jgi:pimeloyl-ACP methyl ester carboxylesterase
MVRMAWRKRIVSFAVLRVLVVVAVCGLLGGCAVAPYRVTTYKPPETPRGIVLVVDGAGGSPAASQAIASAVKKSQLPLFVRSYDWSHGPGLAVVDVTDVDHAQCESRRFAALMTSYRDKFPNTPITVVAYSAGTHVALEATQWLQPDSLDRLVLLAPAVAADYALRPALVAARHIDAFSSRRDGIYLGLGTTILGTVDGQRGVPPAGRVGFDPPPLRPEEAHLANRLHQHPWDPSIAWTGNNGSHDGTLRPKYVRAYVLPLLLPGRGS